MKKLFPILVVGIFIISGFGAVATPFYAIEPDPQGWQGETSGLSRGDELDQYQTDFDLFYLPFGCILGDEFLLAQSFIPQKNILTRVQLYVCKEEMTTCSCKLAIRENLSGESLVEVSISTNEFNVYPDFSWINFDFVDIQVTIGQTYFIVAYVDAVGFQFYDWGGNSSDVYQNGTTYINFDGMWENLTGDMCFKTFGNMEGFPTLAIESVSGGIGVGAIIKNVGSANATGVTWKITVEGGILSGVNVEVEGGKDTLVIDDAIYAETKIFFGLGNVKIMATAKAVDSNNVTREAEGFILLFFVVIR